MYIDQLNAAKNSKLKAKQADWDNHDGLWGFLLIDIPNDSDVKVSCERVLGVGEEAGHDGGSMEPLERIFLGFLGGFGGPLFRFLLLLGRLRGSDDESSETRQLPEFVENKKSKLDLFILFTLYSRIHG